MAVFGYGILRLFCGIIYNKENQNGGNTLSILLNQETLDGLSSAKDEAERVRLFLFYSLGQKEFVCNKIDEETARMQGCYKKHDDTGFLSYSSHTYCVFTGMLVVPGVGFGGLVLGEILEGCFPPFLADVLSIIILFYK